LQISIHLQCSQVGACQTIRKALSRQLLLALKMSGKELVVNRGGVEALALTLVTAKPNGAVLYFTAYVGFPSFLPAHEDKLQGSITLAAALSKNMPVFCESAKWCRHCALQTWHQESTAIRGSVTETYQHQC